MSVSLLLNKRVQRAAAPLMWARMEEYFSLHGFQSRLFMMLSQSCLCLPKVNSLCGKRYPAHENIQSMLKKSTKCWLSASVRRAGLQTAWVSLLLRFGDGVMESGESWGCSVATCETRRVGVCGGWNYTFERKNRAFLGVRDCQMVEKYEKNSQCFKMRHYAYRVLDEKCFTSILWDWKWIF